MNEVKNSWVDVVEELPPSETQVQVSYETFDDTIYCDRFAFCSPTGEWFYVNPATGEVEDFHLRFMLGESLASLFHMMNIYLYSLKRT